MSKKIEVSYTVPVVKTVSVNVPTGYKALKDSDGNYVYRAPRKGELYVVDGSNSVNESYGIHTEGVESQFRLIVVRDWSWPKELGDKTFQIYRSGDDWYATDGKGHISYLNPAIFPWFVKPHDELQVVENPNYSEK